jgi:hypothetical protein
MGAEEIPAIPARETRIVQDRARPQGWAFVLSRILLARRSLAVKSGTYYNVSLKRIHTILFSAMLSRWPEHPGARSFF